MDMDKFISTLNEALVENTEHTLAHVTKDVLNELQRSEQIHPAWPADRFIAYGVIAEEIGELIKAILQYRYENKPKQDIYTEAIQAAAMCIRFLMAEKRGMYLE